MTPRHRALGRLLVSLAALCTQQGCKGCVDEDAAPPVRASKLSPIESRRISVLDRRAARKIDPGKKLVTDAAGVTQCGKDIDCFVLSAERCAPAVLDHTQEISIFGVVQTASARYTVVGETEGGCEVHRELESLDMKLHPELVIALRSQGKTEEDLAKIQADGYAKLKERNPKRLSCRFAGDEALEAVLDLADGKYEPRLWRDRCSPEPDQAAPDQAAPTPSAPAAGPEAVKQGKAPAARQPAEPKDGPVQPPPAAK